MKLSSKFKKVSVALILIISISGEVFSENDYGIYSTYVDSIIYRLKLQDTKTGELIQFRFPPIERGDPYTFSNVEALKFKGYQNNELYGCLFKFSSPLEVTKYAKLKLKLFSKNIDSLNIVLGVGNQNIQVKLGTIKLTNEILFNCLNLDLSSLFHQKEKLDTSQSNYLVNEIKIYCGYSKKKQLIVNDIIAYIPVKVVANSEKNIINEVIRKFPVIYQNQNSFGKEGKFTPKELNLFQKSNVEFLKYRIIKETPQGKENKEKLAKQDELTAIKSSIHSMLVEYFQNTENKKSYLLKEYEDIVSKSKTIDQFYESLELLLYKLNDNHFKMINEITEPSVEVVLPLYFYKIRKSVQVVSVLDTTFIGKVNLGDKLVSINGVPIDDIIEKLDKRVAGSTGHSREMKILQKLLFYVCSIEKKDLKIEFEGIEKGKYYINLTQEQIISNTCLKVPGNIREKQKRFDYKKIGRISYLKIGIFDDKILRPYLYSHIDSIMQSEGLIIDLRNNPGGDLSGLFLFSFFINKPNVYFTFHNIGGYHETVMINPDPFYNYMKPVVILIDARTTCSAEFFLDAMNNSRTNVVSMGTSKTAGSGQNVKYFDLPDTKKFKGGLQYRNSINYSATGKIIDEIGGFTPTVITSFESYLDLAPYNDQLLKMSSDYLNSITKSAQKKSKNMLPIVFILLALAFSISWIFLLIRYRKLLRVNNLTLKNEKSKS